MTRDEFIDGYIARTAENGMRLERTDDGYRSGSHRRVALPCRCGDKNCDGWAMIPADDESIADHMRMYAPE